MEISDKTKKILGILTAWSVVYILMFFLFMFVLFFAELFNLSPLHIFTSDIFNKIFIVVHFLTSLDILGLMVFYIVYLFKTDRVPQDKKALWAVVIFLGHVVAMPVFWYFYVWKKPEPKDQKS